MQFKVGEFIFIFHELVFEGRIVPSWLNPSKLLQQVVNRLKVGSLNRQNAPSKMSHQVNVNIGWKNYMKVSKGEDWVSLLPEY